ncbi:hypothetical protein V8F20_004604 [Naviculisporaceae sp. PSN 640]
MEVASRPQTPTQILNHYKRDTKDIGRHAPEVVDQYQQGDKIGSPALLIYQPETPALPAPPLPHQPSWQRRHPIQSPGPFPVVPSSFPHGDSPTLIAPPVDIPQEDCEKRICGVRRNVFALLLALGFLIVVGVGVGVGVKIGVVDQNRSAGESSETTTPSTASLECPYGANTQIITSGGIEFLHLCSVDYSGKGEATDIANERTPTFKACMEACARTLGCTGAGWGPKLVVEPTRGTCWMKSDLNVSHKATGDFNFGIRLD